MNGIRYGRTALVTALSLALGLGATACSRDYTVGYVYATATTTGTAGVVDGYAIDFQSGALTQLSNSPVPSNGRNPVFLTATPNGRYIYVLNRDDSDVVEFAVGTDGKLYGQNTYNVTGSFPVSAAVDPTGSFLYVASTYQPGFTTAIPGPGNLTVFSIASDGSLSGGTPVNVASTPVSVVASPYASGSTTNFVYVVGTASIPNPTGPAQSGGIISGFSHSNSAPDLTAVPVGNTLINGANVARAGVLPSSITEDATARFVYVTDQLSNQLIGYTVQNGGALSPMVNGPFTTGQFPRYATVDPRAKYLYVTNFNAGTVSAYSIDTATGTPAGTVGSGATATGTNPTCVTIDPALGIYLYTANNNDLSITGLQLSPNDGSLKNIQNTPFEATSLPTCVVAVANGSHATQIVNN